MGALDFLILLATGLFAGFAGGLFGIGGGVIIVPALYAAFATAEVPEEVRIKMAVATSLATIIITSIRSVGRHRRHGNVEIEVLKAWGLFIGLGALAGSALAGAINATWMTGFFAVGIFGIAILRLVDGGKSAAKPGADLPGIMAQRAMASGVGIISALMGIGGGVLGVLILTRAGRSVHRAVGTASGFGLAIAVPGTVGFVVSGLGQGVPGLSLGFVSLPAFLAVAAGTFLAAPVGASTAAKLSATVLTRIFSAYLLFTGVAMMIETIRAAG